MTDEEYQKKSTYPFRWPGPIPNGISPETANTLRCSEPGCKADYRSTGNLRNAGFTDPPNWRCIEHRKDDDPSLHRTDLRLAIQRTIDLAVLEERNRNQGQE